MEFKRATLQSIQTYWISFQDYILHSVFGKPYVTIDCRRVVLDRESIEGCMVFRDNEFPYNTQGHHSVLWYGTEVQPYGISEINEDIDREVRAAIGDDADYDYGWYVNPKMTVPEFFHVQVFWEKRS